VDTARIAAAPAGNFENINFVTDNILTTVLQGPCDLITDTGCYTLLEQWMQEQYCRNIHRLLAPAGWLLIKVNADSDEIRPLEASFRIEFSTHGRFGLQALRGSIRPPQPNQNLSLSG
jgi:hypothetical protein